MCLLGCNSSDLLDLKQRLKLYRINVVIGLSVRSFPNQAEFGLGRVGVTFWNSGYSVDARFGSLAFPIYRFGNVNQENADAQTVGRQS